MLEDFPSTNGPDREKLILDIVDNHKKRLSYEWYSLKLEHNGHHGIFFVMADALKIDGIRVNVTADTQQRIADKWGSCFLTAKLCDLIWHNADIRLEPRPRSITSSTKAMIAHSQDVDKQLKNIDSTKKLISNVGKYWIIDSKMNNPRFSNQAINYGWYFKESTFQGITGGPNASLLKNPETGSYWKMIQTIGKNHNSFHTDYSQICRVVTRECFVDDKPMDLHDVLKDPELSYLISHTGPQPILRQPGVPEPMTVFIV